MSDKTRIEWTDATWNPIRGCSRVSEGCRHCYAETVANRFKDPGQPYEGLIAKGGQWNGNITVVNHILDQPLRWKKPRKVFVNSMSDLFHEKVPEYAIDRIFAVMAMAARHQFQILTKRPQRMMEYCKRLQSRADDIAKAAVNHWGGEDPDNLYDWVLELIMVSPLPNVWLGVSVEDQAKADERIPLLLQTPAAVRWISAEPLLGPIDLDDNVLEPSCGACGSVERDNSLRHSRQLGHYHCDGGCDCTAWPYSKIRRGLDWVVIGGESGSNARPMHPDWARSIRDQCQAAGVPFLFKQWGEWLPGEQIPGQTTYARCDNGQVMSYRGNPRRDNFQTHPDKHSGHLITLKIGKKAAGRTLDGYEWNEYPVIPSE